ncbi:RNA helicase required for poly(A+) mRNA export [Elasticomyces elasticus]|nr:RNA helicase required for poly(A+) mRNA export [Elasticomyces elasticus]KAK4998404.1 RNA helicase required for poly(A+) mRNA export [Elasticomyces elasticus]
MADTPTDSKSEAPSRSLADRLNTSRNGTNAEAPSFTPGKISNSSWASDKSSPSPQLGNGVESAKTASVSPPAPTTTASSDLAQAMMDGAAPWQGDSEYDDNVASALDEPEFDVNVKLSDLRADPNSPLHSAIKSFAELNLPPELEQGLIAMNFTRPSKIQERALPLLLANPPTNLIAQSQSGTGKTAAFVLNILTRIDRTLPAAQAVVLAPTRELARQILSVAQTMGSVMTDLTFRAAVPDPEKRGQKVVEHLVVGTPGTISDMIKRRLFDVSHVQILVLDEADSMLDMSGMGEQCKRVKHLLPKDVQVNLFSATFPEQVMGYAYAFAPDPNVITLEVKQLTVEGIKQIYMPCGGDEKKYQLILKLYELMTISSSIIFVARRDTAVELERRMVADGHTVASLTGALDGPERDAIIDKFRKGNAKVLIATNVLSRGIDVQSVTVVINYDVPLTSTRNPDPETYLHRIGRTGRFGRVGVAITLCQDRRAVDQYHAICRHFSVKPYEVLPGNWDEVEAQLKRIIKGSRAGKNLDVNA